MKIEILLLCHNYQRRLIWDLSSIYHQGTKVTLIPSVCTLANNGTPETEKVVEYFSHFGLRVKHLVCKDPERFAKRGYTRNDQLKVIDPDTDYVLFSDCDMIYEVGFFEELATKLLPLKGTYGMYCVGRFSNDASVINQMVDSLSYPTLVDRARLEEVAKISDRKMGNVGAGYFQMIEPQFTGGFYVEEGKSNDRHMFNRGLNPKSDMQFRHRIGNNIKLSLNKKQFHLNHDRDPEAGKHLEIQR